MRSASASFVRRSLRATTRSSCSAISGRLVSHGRSAVLRSRARRVSVTAVAVAVRAAGLGLGGAGVGLLTGVDVADFVVAEDSGVHAVATVGLGAPAWAAAPDG